MTNLGKPRWLQVVEHFDPMKSGVGSFGWFPLGDLIFGEVLRLPSLHWRNSGSQAQFTCDLFFPDRRIYAMYEHFPGQKPEIHFEQDDSLALSK